MSTEASPNPSADLRPRGTGQYVGSRALVAITGSTDFCRHAAIASIGDTGHRRWLGSDAPDGFESVSTRGARQWLGSECDTLVVDAHAGFDPDTVGAAAGTVRADGRMLLLVPPLDVWSRHADPVNERVAVHGTRVDGSRYLARCAALLPAVASQWVSDTASTTVTPAPTRPWAPPAEPTPDQTQLVADLVAAVASPGALAAVVRADRGRGKSAALGLLAAALAGRGYAVFVTAPSRRATDVLFRHAAEHWPAQAEASAPAFLAPDAPHPPVGNSVLLVDEAGGLHLGLTKRLLQHWSKVVFAGTVHGYEGAGRGFATRFRQLLETLPHHSPLFTLEQPLRWPPGDPLESALNRLLMLDATHAAPRGAPTCRWLDRDRLLEQEPYLRAVYALLSEAHYRTRPLDLRHLLDGPNLRVAVIDCAGQPVAAALIADEGPFADRELVAAIAGGTRRPRGHLMPQLLTWQYGLEHACTQRWWRVVRIAVDSAQRREGLGAQLLTWLQEQALIEQVDAVCTSFGADNAVLSFWEASGYQAAYLGHVREATSGAFAVAMVRSLTPRNRDLMALARAAFATALHQRTPDDPTLEARLHPRDCPREH